MIIPSNFGYIDTITRNLVENMVAAHEFHAVEHELNSARMKLSNLKAELREKKIDILKNGSQEDKINLLIRERLEELENERTTYVPWDNSDN